MNEDHDAGPVFRSALAEVTHAELALDVYGLRDKVPRGGTAFVRSQSAVVVGAVFAALEGWAADVRLAGAWDPSEVEAESVVINDSVLESASTGASSEPGDPVATRWWLYTSGTTGRPKSVGHSFVSLARRARAARPGAPKRRWGLLYEPTRMAGVQVILQALTAGDDLFDTNAISGVGDRISWLGAQGVDSLSATPTVWRQILQTPASEELDLRQVTLGGEIADQKLLDALHGRFGLARVTHVFASTETGAAFAVSDGREGFPLSYLEDAPGGIQLRVKEGLLQIAADSTATAEDGFVSTGDMVEITAERVLFKGRATGQVNVGGTNVSPEHVEATLRDHPEVLDAVVTARRNAFSGWILTAAVVATESADRVTLAARCRELCASQLSSASVPATVKVVETLTTAPSGKAVRR